MKNQKGFTLLALVIIVVAASLVAAVSMELISVSEEDRMRELTLQRVKEIQKAIYGDPDIYPQTDFGYVADIGALPTSLDDLINDTGDPNWNGPYLTTDFSDANPADQLDDASGTDFVYDPDAGTIGTADGSPIDIPPQHFQFDPEELTNATLCGTVRDIDGNIPEASDLENIYITLVYTINIDPEEEEEEPDAPRRRWRPFWWMWDTAEDHNYKWKWKPHSRRWWGGRHGGWWNEGMDPWWEQDRDYEPQIGVWKNWWQSSSDRSWWSDMTQYYPHQKKWGFWWWWRHKCKDRNNPPPDTETYGRFVTIHPNADGTFCFNDIAIGSYTVEATHDLLGVTQEKPVAILPAVDNTVSFRFPAVMPGYPGYGEEVGDTEASALRTNYTDLIIDGDTDESVRLANGRAEGQDPVTIDQIKVSWSDAGMFEKIQKIRIDGHQVWSKSFWGSGRPSGSIIDIQNYSIDPLESNKILKLYFKNNYYPKELELVFLMIDDSEKLVPEESAGGGDDPPPTLEEADLLEVTYSDLTINGFNDDDISIGDTSSTEDITLDKIQLSWSNASHSQKIRKVKINGSQKWYRFLGRQSGYMLDIQDVLIPASTGNFVVRFEFNKNLQNKDMNVRFIMSDNSEKIVQ
ncbi:hypothetical protein ACFL40_00790 [candidate division KSB1 bacterium]